MWRQALRQVLGEQQLCALSAHPRSSGHSPSTFGFSPGSSGSRQCSISVDLRIVPGLNQPQPDCEVEDVIESNRRVRSGLSARDQAGNLPNGGRQPVLESKRFTAVSPIFAVLRNLAESEINPSDEKSELD